MLDAQVLKRLSENAPEAVMVRAILEHSLQVDAVDQVFERSCENQYTRTLLFSSVVSLMASVVCRVRRSVSSAFQLHRDQFTVSLKSIYNKINSTEPQVCQELFNHCTRQMRELNSELGVERTPLLPGYQTRILDGNQFAATEHRIKELRTISSGPLPGKVLAVWDADAQLIDQVYCCEDSYTQERKIVVEVFDSVEPDQLWIADRNFCTSMFLTQVHISKAFFLVRRHQKNVRFHETGEAREIGKTETGIVWETPVTIEDNFGASFAARLIRVELNQKTRDKDTSLELLTNLPTDVIATEIADVYRQRWQIETVYFELDRVFEGEIKSLGHPGAALLAFTLSLIAYNSLQLVRSALAAAHGKSQADEVSDYYLSEVVFTGWYALDLLGSSEEWQEEFAGKNAKAIAKKILQLAKKVDLHRLRKHKRGLKKPQPKRTQNKNKPHVSTKRVLDARRDIK